MYFFKRAYKLGYSFLIFYWCSEPFTFNGTTRMFGFRIFHYVLILCFLFASCFSLVSSSPQLSISFSPPYFHMYTHTHTLLVLELSHICWSPIRQCQFNSTIMHTFNGAWSLFCLLVCLFLFVSLRHLLCSEFFSWVISPIWRICFNVSFRAGA